MPNIDDVLKDFPLVSLREGDCLLKQGETTNSLYFLHEGSVNIIKDGFKVAASSGRGSVFGEMSIMLGNEHSATVQCVEDSRFYHIDDPEKYLETHPEVIWQIAKMLSRRMFNLNQYFVNMKSQHDESDQQSSDELKDMNYRKIMANEALKILQVH